MPTTVRICTVLNHIDEREAFWTVFAMPSKPLRPNRSIGEVGAGDTEASAIADYRRRACFEDHIAFEITRRDNVNIDIHEGGDRS